VSFRTASSSGSWNLLSAENLRVLGKSSQDIAEVGYTEFFPDLPYLERDVAWSPHHPLIGSGSAYIAFKDGTGGCIDDIFYQDLNPRQDHADGKPHWNHERRFFLSTWPEPKRLKEKIEHHVIAKSPWMEITTEVPRQVAKQVKCFWLE
jgi:hypothetical protein